MSSVRATRDQPGPSTRSVRAPPGANAERMRLYRGRGVDVGTGRLERHPYPGVPSRSGRVRRAFTGRAAVGPLPGIRRVGPAERGLVVDPAAPGRPLQGYLVRPEAPLRRPPHVRVRRCQRRRIVAVRSGWRVVGLGDPGCGHRQRERPSGERADHGAVIGREVVLHPAVPRGDGDRHQRDVLHDDRPPGAPAVLAEHQAVPLGVRFETERAARGHVVVAEHAGELRGSQQHRGQHEQCVVVGGRPVRPSHSTHPHPSFLVAWSVGAP